MDKSQFLSQIHKALSAIPRADREGYADYYAEMIDELVEEGKNESEAIESIGSVEDISNQILADTPLPVLVKERVRPATKMRTWEIALLTLGAPLWLPLILALTAVIFAVFIVIWSIIVCFIAVGLSLLVSAVFIIIKAFSAPFYITITLIGVFIMLIGAVILFGIAIKNVVKAVLVLSKKFLLLIKRCFARKGNKNDK